MVAGTEILPILAALKYFCSHSVSEGEPSGLGGEALAMSANLSTSQST